MCVPFSYNRFLNHQSITGISWAPNGETLASSSLDNTVRLWNRENLRRVMIIGNHNDGALSVSWASDGKTIASGSYSMVLLWNSDNGQLLGTLAHEVAITSVSFSPDAKTLASGSSNNTVKLWNPHDGQLINTLSAYNHVVLAVSWAPDGNTLASASSDKTVRLWNPHDGRLINTLNAHEDGVFAVSWAPDGNTLASASYDNTVRLWETRSGKLLKTIEVGHGLQSFSWEKGGQHLVLGFWTGYNEIWGLQSDPPRPLARFYNTPNGSGFAVTPDGYVSGPPEALEYVRFGDGWALYDLTDVPERLSPERVKAALNPSGAKGVARKGRKVRK